MNCEWPSRCIQESAPVGRSVRTGFPNEKSEREKVNSMKNARLMLLVILFASASLASADDNVVRWEDNRRQYHSFQ